MPLATSLQRITVEEQLLLELFRSCDSQGQTAIAEFCSAAAARAADRIPANVVKLQPRKVFLKVS